LSQCVLLWCLWSASIPLRGFSMCAGDIGSTYRTWFWRFCWTYTGYYQSFVWFEELVLICMLTGLMKYMSKDGFRQNLIQMFGWMIKAITSLCDLMIYFMLVKTLMDSLDCWKMKDTFWKGLVLLLIILGEILSELLSMRMSLRGDHLHLWRNVTEVWENVWRSSSKE
jgi:hypothetical protein